MSVAPTSMEKRCSDCAETKPRDAFAKRAASRDGLCYRCRACAASAALAWREKNPGAFKQWYAANKMDRAEYWRAWYEENKGERAKSYASWAKQNRATVAALCAKRNAAKLRATVKWADQEKIKRLYEDAARLTLETGIRHEVDHIYPLQGKEVCGLHCEANLQILTKAENIRKHNRMPEEVA